MAGRFALQSLGKHLTPILELIDRSALPKGKRSGRDQPSPFLRSKNHLERHNRDLHPTSEFEALRFVPTATEMAGNASMLLPTTTPIDIAVFCETPRVRSMLREGEFPSEKKCYFSPHHQQARFKLEMTASKLSKSFCKNLLATACVKSGGGRMRKTALLRPPVSTMRPYSGHGDLGILPNLRRLPRSRGCRIIHSV